MLDVTPDNLHKKKSAQNYNQNATNWPVYPVHYSIRFYKLRAALQHHRYIVAGVQEVLSQVTAENALPENAGLLQPSSWWPVQNKTSKERDQFAVFPQHGLYRC